MYIIEYTSKYPIWGRRRTNIVTVYLALCPAHCMFYFILFFKKSSNIYSAKNLSSLNVNGKVICSSPHFIFFPFSHSFPSILSKVPFFLLLSWSPWSFSFLPFPVLLFCCSQYAIGSCVHPLVPSGNFYS